MTARIAVLHNPECTITQEAAEAELIKHYPKADFEIFDAQLLAQAEGIKDIGKGLTYWFMTLAAYMTSEREVCIVCTRSFLGEGDKRREADMVLAQITPTKLLSYFIYPGGGVRMRLGRPEETYPLPKENTLQYVFENIADNDKERLS